MSLTITVPQKTASLPSPLERVWARLRPWLPEVSEAVAVSIGGIAAIEVQVSATDINPPQTERVTVSTPTSGQEIVLALDVKAGENRTFTVYGLNAANVRIYRGSQSGVALTAGSPMSFSILVTDIPIVTSVTPANGATGVSTTTTVQVTFSKAMNASTITPSTFTVSGVTGAVTCNTPCLQATFTPAVPLSSDTTFNVIAAQTITDTVGSPLNSVFTSTFTITGTLPTTGTVTGTVTNAVTGASISGATVTIVGTSLTTTTNTSGAFTLNNVPTGPQTVQANASGFVTNSVLATVTAGGTTNVGISLSPSGGVVTDQIRIILNWGATPLDLDSHLLVPTSGGPTEVYWLNKGTLTASPFAQLDHDDTDGFGPETITITAPATTPPPRYSGTYCYFVHNFSGEAPITSSGASIQVLNGTTEINRFVVPTTGTGFYWKVFTLDGQTGVITPLGSGNGVISTTPSC